MSYFYFCKPTLIIAENSYAWQYELPSVWSDTPQHLLPPAESYCVKFNNEEPTIMHVDLLCHVEEKINVIGWHTCTDLFVMQPELSTCPKDVQDCSGCLVHCQCLVIPVSIKYERLLTRLQENQNDTPLCFAGVFLCVHI